MVKEIKLEVGGEAKMVKEIKLEVGDGTEVVKEIKKGSRSSLFFCKSFCYAWR